MTANFNFILREVRTKDDLLSLENGLRELEVNLYGSGEKSWENVLASVWPKKFSVSLLKILGEAPPAEQQAKLKELLPALKNILGGVRALKIDLAFEPSDALIENLNQWVDENLGYDVVLDIGYEKILLGGARLAFEGKYGDFSASKILAEILQGEKKHITSN